MMLIMAVSFLLDSWQRALPLPTLPVTGRDQSDCPARMRVLESKAQWIEFWKPCGLHPDPPAELGGAKLVAVCLGPRAGGGSVIEVRAEAPKRGPVVIYVRESPPGGGPLTVTTSPCELFRIPERLASADWRKPSFVIVPQK